MLFLNKIILRAKINGNLFGSSQFICVLVIFIVSSQMRWILVNLGWSTFFVFQSTSLGSNQLLWVLVNSFEFHYTFLVVFILIES